eukprot:gi/632986049/ref/XP_007910021.1/ PREDICTED: uncharacterized protein LOC103190910 [Callorhinchus milii]
MEKFFSPVPQGRRSHRDGTSSEMDLRGSKWMEERNLAFASPSSSSSWSSEASFGNETFLSPDCADMNKFSRSCTDVRDLRETGKCSGLYRRHSRSVGRLYHEDLAGETAISSLERVLGVNQRHKVLASCSAAPKPTKGILKHVATSRTDLKRKARSMEVLAVRGAEPGSAASPHKQLGGFQRSSNTRKPDYQPLISTPNPAKAKATFVQQKLNFSRFLDEITLQVMSPSSLDSLRLTCGRGSGLRSRDLSGGPSLDSLDSRGWGSESQGQQRARRNVAEQRNISPDRCSVSNMLSTQRGVNVDTYSGSERSYHQHKPGGRTPSGSREHRFPPRKHGQVSPDPHTASPRPQLRPAPSKHTDSSSHVNTWHKHSLGQAPGSPKHTDSSSSSECGTTLTGSDLSKELLTDADQIKLQESCSSVQQTTQLMEEKLHMMAQNMETERKCLNRKITDLTTSLKVAQRTISTLEKINVRKRRSFEGECSRISEILLMMIIVFAQRILNCQPGSVMAGQQLQHKPEPCDDVSPPPCFRDQDSNTDPGLSQSFPGVEMRGVGQSCPLLGGLREGSGDLRGSGTSAQRRPTFTPWTCYLEAETSVPAPGQSEACRDQGKVPTHCLANLGPQVAPLSARQVAPLSTPHCRSLSEDTRGRFGHCWPSVRGSVGSHLSPWAELSSAPGSEDEGNEGWGKPLIERVGGDSREGGNQLREVSVVTFTHRGAVNEDTMWQDNPALMSPSANPKLWGRGSGWGEWGTYRHDSEDTVWEPQDHRQLEGGKRNGARAQHQRQTLCPVYTLSHSPTAAIWRFLLRAQSINRTGLGSDPRCSGLPLQSIASGAQPVELSLGGGRQLEE